MSEIRFATPIFAPALYGAATGPVMEAAMLPSDRLERARPRIQLSTFIVHPGPVLEALMRAAAFRATEHKYDL